MSRKVDLSELYDFLRSKAGTYVLCFDVCSLMPINENYGSKAGDAVILEAYRRIDEAAGDDMAVFRIGGDEFAGLLFTTQEEMKTRLGDFEKRMEAWSDSNGITLSASCGYACCSAYPNSGIDSLACGNEIVVGIAVLHVHDIVLEAQADNVFSKYNFHSLSSCFYFIMSVTKGSKARWRALFTA